MERSDGSKPKRLKLAPADLDRFSREEFEQLVGPLEEELEGLLIPPDPSPSALLRIESDLDRLFTRVSFLYGYYQEKFDKVTDWIKDAKMLSVEGANADDRQAARLAYMRDYPLDEAYSADLLALRDHFRERFSRLERIVRIIESKTQRIITINGLLKLEEELTRP